MGFEGNFDCTEVLIVNYPLKINFFFFFFSFFVIFLESRADLPPQLLLLQNAIASTVDQREQQ